VEAFKSQDLSGHISLAKSERSPLAELAAELL
jgi:predicted ribonuclease YlaK